jgi:hypothetical protein
VKRAVLLLLACGACGGGSSGDAGVDADDGFREIGMFSIVANPDVDLLFVLDDSNGTADLQQDLKNNFRALLDVLAAGPGGMPNLHIGLTTPDLGTRGEEDAQPAPDVANCSGTGRNGALHGSAMVSGPYISDSRGAGDTRTINYSGTLVDAFASITALGTNGCAFEQPFEAAKVALTGNPANAGFRRPGANLVIVVDQDEDDCSLAHNALVTADPSLGALDSFRCTRFGITCDVRGTTPDEMAMIGSKSACHSNESSPYLTRVADYPAFFESLVASRSRVAFASFVGNPTPVVVMERGPLGGDTVPYLAPSCRWPEGSPVANPGIRIEELARKFDRHVTSTVCRDDQTPALHDLGSMIAGMTGDMCLHQDIALPASCQAVLIQGAASRTVPQCGTGPGGNECFQIVSDPAQCPLGQHMRLEPGLASQPADDQVMRLRCVPLVYSLE